MFGGATATIKAIITAEDRASKTLNKFGANTSKLGSIAASTAKYGLAALGAAAAWSTKQFIDEEKATAQLNAVLKSTKGIAGVTASAATDLASSLQKTSTFADEAVIEAEALLLTFTKIGKDIFPDATKIVLDMSTALGQDLKSSSIQVGKALQDPILGVTALRRVGVNFSNAQKEVIKKLVETGQSAKAQALIMKELQTEFGGSAKAASETLGGSLTKLKNNLSELGEGVGGFISRFLKPLVDGVNRSIEANAGASASMVILMNHQLHVKQSTAALKAAQQQARIAADQVKDAQTRYNNAVLSFGPKSQQAIAALRKLREAQLKDAQAKSNAASAQQILNAAEESFVRHTPAHLQAIQKRAVKLGLVVEAAESGAVAMQGLDALIGNVRRDALSLKGVVQGVKSGGLKIEPKAAGGPVEPGRPYLVGEKGPELVVPRRSGQVIPNNKLSAVSSKGGSVVNYHFHIGHLIANGVQERKFAERIVKNIKDIASMQGTTAKALLG